MKASMSVFLGLKTKKKNSLSVNIDITGKHLAVEHSLQLLFPELLLGK
jgi:hypothetical protein